MVAKVSVYKEIGAEMESLDVRKMVFVCPKNVCCVYFFGLLMIFSGLDR